MNVEQIVGIIILWPIFGLLAVMLGGFVDKLAKNSIEKCPIIFMFLAGPLGLLFALFGLLVVLIFFTESDSSFLNNFYMLGRGKNEEIKK